jgi:succinoglycan biosynthesis protein ExoA
VGDQQAVLVVVPTFNEAAHLDQLIAQLLRDAGQLRLKLVVADGGSTDATCDIVRRINERDGRVVLLDCNRRIAGAINEAVAKYGDDADFLIRIDAHAEYPAQFCRRLLAVQMDTGADSVVVSMTTTGQTCFQRAAAAAQNSLLGNGGSPHRNQSSGRWVDHGHHAVMRMAAFRDVGGYDEAFFWNEDAELDARLRGAGYRIYLAGGLSIGYFPRGSAAGLLRQYFNYGRGRAQNFLKHRETLRMRQLIPLAVAPALALALLFPASPLFAAPALVWCTLCLGYGAWIGAQSGDRCACGAGIAAILMHAGWSFGFIAGMASRLLAPSRGASPMFRPTLRP